MPSHPNIPEPNRRKRNRSRQRKRKRLQKLIHQHQPWKKSTGPRTEAGKKIASQNALKHGLYSHTFREARKAQTAGAAEIQRLIAERRAAGPGKVRRSKTKEWPQGRAQKSEADTHRLKFC